LTVVASAIRIAGRRTWKIVIGRARESRATAKAELLPSTSDEVYELWSGKEVVRLSGQPEPKEIIYKPPPSENQGFTVFSDNDTAGSL
jgi:hypothetical protein